MGRSIFDQETQLRPSDSYVDNLSAGQANLETPSTDTQFDFNALRSQVKRILDHSAGQWYDDVYTTATSKKRSLKTLNVDLDDLEEKRLDFRTQVYTDISVPASAAATDILTLGAAPTAAETVIVDGKVYTFVVALTTPIPVEGEVLIEVTASDSIDNLVNAIIHGPGNGTKYSCALAHPTVTAAAGALDTMDVAAITPGTSGNLIAVSETLAAPASVWTTAKLAGGAGDTVVLSVAGVETPTEHGAVGGVSTKGAIVAYNSDFPNWKLCLVSGPHVLRPLNLCIVRDTTTSEVIISGGKDVYALLCCENVTDDQVFDDTTKQVELVFVKENAGGTALVIVPTADIGGKSINYSYAQRIDLDHVPEWAFLSEVFVDQSAATDVTRQNAYTFQGTTPVDVITNSILDIQSVGKYWQIRDNNEDSLFKITENSTGSATDIEVGTAVDTFNVKAAANDFTKPVTVDSSGVDLQLGVTTIANKATIDTLSGNDLRLMGTRELYFDDGNAPVGWSDTSGIKLSDTAQEWTDFETFFGGEVSILNAIVQAKTGTSRTNGWANVITADIPAGTLITGAAGSPNISVQLPSYKGLSFIDDVETFVNGAKQRPGANAGALMDVYPSAVVAEQAQGAFYSLFKLKVRGGAKPPDNINTVVWGVPTP